jgi:hypothetical protein
VIEISSLRVGVVKQLHTNQFREHELSKAESLLNSRGRDNIQLVRERCRRGSRSSRIHYETGARQTLLQRRRWRSLTKNRVSQKDIVSGFMLLRILLSNLPVHCQSFVVLCCGQCFEPTVDEFAGQMSSTTILTPYKPSPDFCTSTLFVFVRVQKKWLNHLKYVIEFILDQNCH